MIHEVGHVLGLYHVFKGVSERESCDDPCRETVPSMETGDLCADTAPTPKSKLCQNPEPANDTCGFTYFPGAPFNNYMSYTGITTVLMDFFSVKITWRPLWAGRVEVWELESIIKSHSCQRIEAYLSWHLFFMSLKNLQKYWILKQFHWLHSPPLKIKRKTYLWHR